MLPCENSDTIQVDLTVANVADGLFDSSLVVDFVAKPKVKIGDLVAVIKNDVATVGVIVSSSTQPTNITLLLSTRGGTGAAQFTSNNSTTMTITQTTPVEIKGLTESSTRNNIRIEAKDDQGKKLDDEDFSVLWVTLSLRTSGGVSSENAARAVIGQFQGNSSPTLGTVYHTGLISVLGKLWASAAVGTTRRQRLNLNEFATYNGKKASADMPWFSRMSIVRTTGRDAIINDVPGDNVAGTGATPLTWNLQP